MQQSKSVAPWFYLLATFVTFSLEVVFYGIRGCEFGLIVIVAGTLFGLANVMRDSLGGRWGVFVWVSGSCAGGWIGAFVWLSFNLGRIGGLLAFLSVVSTGFAVQNLPIRSRGHRMEADEL